MSTPLSIYSSSYLCITKHGTTFYLFDDVKNTNVSHIFIKYRYRLAHHRCFIVEEKTNVFSRYSSDINSRYTSSTKERHLLVHPLTHAHAVKHILFFIFHISNHIIFVASTLYTAISKILPSGEGEHGFPFFFQGLLIIAS